jgi:hypothetical protein
MELNVSVQKTALKIALLLGSAVTAFSLGLFSSQSVKPVVSPINASSTVLEGDLNRNGVIDAADAQLALDIARGYKVATPEELAADPNRDYHITADDVMVILEILNRSVGISK